MEESVGNELLPQDAIARRYHTIIDSSTNWFSLGLGEIWQYRDLLSMLVWRDFLSRYRQSLLGVGWAIFRPLMSVAVFTLFSGMMKIEIQDVPYPLFSLTGLIPWLYFSGTLTTTTNSVAGASSLVTKVYFPRLILPLAAVVGGWAEVGIQLLILAVMMLCYRTEVSWTILAAPFFLFQCVLLSLSLGLWLTAMNVRYRDIGHAVPFLIGVGFFATPVIYPATRISPQWQSLYGLNPMAGIIEGFRWSVLGTDPPGMAMFTYSLTVTLILSLSGLLYFRRVEDYFADIV